MRISDITAERLRELVIYEPETGNFFWRQGRGKYGNAAPAGKLAGHTRVNGYKRIRVEQRIYYSHRLAWLYVYGEWPANTIDHINGNPSDNRLCNLRNATQAQNLANQRLGVRNRSGFKGVSWSKRDRAWAAYVYKNGKSIRVGNFDSAAAAHAAYCRAAQDMYGEFWRAA